MSGPCSSTTTSPRLEFCGHYQKQLLTPWYPDKSAFVCIPFCQSGCGFAEIPARRYRPVPTSADTHGLPIYCCLQTLAGAATPRTPGRYSPNPRHTRARAHPVLLRELSWLHHSGFQPTLHSAVFSRCFPGFHCVALQYPPPGTCTGP